MGSRAGRTKKNKKNIKKQAGQRKQGGGSVGEHSVPDLGSAQ
jgi:hypothetical protein